MESEEFGACVLSIESEEHGACVRKGHCLGLGVIRGVPITNLNQKSI